jgi:hypothetical protein
MIDLKEELTSQGVRKCPRCGGRGVITIFRNDWEEMDEIKCGHCPSLED